MPLSPASSGRRARLPAWRATALAAALSLSASGLFLAPAARAQQAQASVPAVAGPLWGHEQVQRAPDPAARFGRLPNGLRYALQHNETPKDGVAMRMRIGAGSLQERDGEQGLAHFLEHMAFRGSAKVADGEVVHMLQRQGLSFGADTNAFTDFDQTVYHFNFPKADAAALDTGLMLFREIGEHLKLDAQLIEQEKGVVLSEERTRDVPGMRAFVAEQSLTLAGTRVAQRLPIGRIDTVQATTVDKLRRYYQANYRPDNATLIVVGNIDVDAVEKQIRERFADWKAAGKPDALDLGAVKPTQPAAEFIADGAPDKLSLTWPTPPDMRPPTLALSRDVLVQQLAAGVLNVRLADRALKPGSPFLGAFGMKLPRLYKVTGQAQLNVMAPPEKWADALDAATTELRQLQAQGVQPADLQRLLPLIRSSLQAMVAQAPTRQSAAIADGLINAVHYEGIYQSAEQAMAEAEPMLASVKPEELTAVLRRDFSGQPLIFRSAKAGAAGAPMLSAKLAQALSRPLEAQAAAVAVTWPYADFGAASAIVSKTTDAELGSTTLAFANGSRLVIKPTAQEKDKVIVQVLVGQGMAGLKPELVPASWTLNMFPLGGTGRLSLAEVAQWQQSSGVLAGLTLQLDSRRILLVGETRPADLKPQLQLLAAFVRDPGFRPEMGEKLAGVAPMMANQFETLPGIVYARELSKVMNNGESRLGGVPTAAELLAAKADDAAAILRPAFAGAPDVVVIGDVSEEAAIAAVQATFGAGPARPRLPAVPLKATPPADGGAAHVALHKGRADQGMLGWHWPMPDQWTDVALSNTGRVAATLLQTRLVDVVREKLGITYAPSAGGGGSLDVAGQGSFFAQIETPPEKFEAFREVLRAQLKALAAEPVSADELLRAKQPMVEQSRKAPEYNGHWAYWLQRILVEPRMKTMMQRETANLEAVTAEQVQAFFRDRIAARAPIEVGARAAEAGGPAAAPTNAK
ncbi:zinc protease [Pelomonas saccharophila]|uniref:Zinc protease n=1 Tax=Roseateles saccharophilus TaxID=304 RepID=A0ABU1YTM4_ROSSA|nr:insulinase family protein [Roseateles saccharophilus]MDR7271521.1 zinc protease [Roseateles saccharophilus]